MARCSLREMKWNSCGKEPCSEGGVVNLLFPKQPEHKWKMCWMVEEEEMSQFPASCMQNCRAWVHWMMTQGGWCEGWHLEWYSIGILAGTPLKGVTGEPWAPAFMSGSSGLPPHPWTWKIITGRVKETRGEEKHKFKEEKERHCTRYGWSRMKGKENWVMLNYREKR